MTGEKLSDVLTARLLQEMEGYLELELHEEVVERADRLLAAGREPERALRWKAQALQNEGRFEQAIAAYHELRVYAPDDDAVELGLGWCHKRTGRLDLALAALERLVEREPGNALAVYNLSCYLALDGDRDRSLELLEQAIGLEEGFRAHARQEEDFDGIREDPEFRRLVGA